MTSGGPVVPLTPLLAAKLDKLFSGADRDIARRMLEQECGFNLPLIQGQGEIGIERTRAGALKCSEGRLDKLRYWVDMAKIDWRDAMVAGGFGHSVTEHQRWLAEE